MEDIKVTRLENGNLLVRVPVSLSWSGRSVGRRVASGTPRDGEDAARDAFLLALARGRRWQRLIDEGEVGGNSCIAELIGKDGGFVARSIRLTLLSPEIIEKAVRGELPVGLSSNLARQSIPDSWREQAEMLLVD